MSVCLPLSPLLPFSYRCQYTYLATLSCLVCFGVAFTFFKFQEGALVAGPYLDPSLTLAPGFMTLPDGQSPLSFPPFFRPVCSSPLPVTPIPLEYYAPQNKKWVLPLLLVLSVGWGCELSVPPSSPSTHHLNSTPHPALPTLKASPFSIIRVALY